MAATPAYAASPLAGSAAAAATADNTYSAPAQAQNVVNAGANGSKIDEVVFEGIGTTVAGTITVFLYDGASYYLYDVVQVPAVTASSTVPPWRAVKGYANLQLPAGWSLRFSSTVASQLVRVTAIGGSY